MGLVTDIRRRVSLDSGAAIRLCGLVGWAVVIWVVVFWRLGYASFWDPDEAVYAQVTREMLRSGDWLAPMYNGAPFFDKPILFYWLQLSSFAAFGETEFAARLVPALSAVALIGATRHAGALFFDVSVGRLAALMVALLPGTVALSAYAILDMTFTAFLFAGVCLVASAAVHDRPRRQWGGYGLILLAVLTKGPLAMVLAGLAFTVALVIVPGARRPLLGLRWITGAILIVVLSSPWFLYMWWRFGYAFIEGYFLRENIWLYSKALYTSTTSGSFFLRVIATGLLPWTPIVVGRLIDALRQARLPTPEGLFLSWAIAVVGFFSFSHFRFDHYVYPAIPALCLLAASAWMQLRRAANIRPHLGVAVGIALVPVILVAAGFVLESRIRIMPIDLARGVVVAPIALVGSGLLFALTLVRLRLRPPVSPIVPAVGLLAVYAVVRLVGLDAFERAKPIKSLAMWVSANAPADATVAAYRLDRWRASMRFYVDRPTTSVNTPEILLEFLNTSGVHYVVARREDYDKAMEAARRLEIVGEQDGLTNTSGRSLRRDRSRARISFVVATDRGW